MTAVDEWTRFIKEQVNNLEKWASTHPLESGFILVAAASVGTFLASKLYDAWVRRA